MSHLIAIVTNNDDDIYCFRKELIEGLIDAGYEILIVCPDGPKFELMQDVKFLHDKYEIDRRGTNVISDFKLLCHYHHIFKRYQPDVILTYTAKPNVYATIAASLLKIPTINNVTGFGSIVNEKPLKKKLIMSLFKFAYRRSRCIMFQNSTNMRLAKEMGMVNGKSILIPGSGVALNRFPLQNYPDGGDGIDGVPVIFNYIGRILKDKGIDNYIEAARIIKSQYPNCEFNIIGFIEPTEEKYYGPLLKKLEEEGIIIYRGSQKDVRPFIARSHATIHPSTYGEGMSNVLLESAASGRVIITTDNPGCKETILEGESGYLYQGGSVQELVDTIKKFLKLSNDARKKMGLIGRHYIEENFSRNKIIDAYINEIHTFLL